MKIIATVLLIAVAIMVCVINIACLVVGTKLTPQEQEREDAFQLAEIQREAKARQQSKKFLINKKDARCCSSAGRATDL